MTTRKFFSVTALALALPMAAQAQGTAAAQDQTPVEFSAQRVEYDSANDLLTATGDVRLAREGKRVRADKVTWNRKTGRVLASGDVIVVNPGGDTAYGDTAELTDTLKQGVVDNFLLVLADGGRLASRKAERQDDLDILTSAAYTPCPVTDATNCPRKPSWYLTAVRIVHDPKTKRLRLRRAQLHLFGVPLFTVPNLVLAVGGTGSTGFLAPDLRYSRTNGLELAIPFYYKIAPNRDLTVTPHFYSAVLPALASQYRALTEDGAYQITGWATASTKLPVTVGATSADASRSFRGYLDASGRFQLDPEWSVSGSIRRTTDRTFLRRYEISNDDRLRSVLRVEHDTPDSYLTISNWAFQTLRVGELQGQTPLALPEADYRRRLDDPLFGGVFTAQLNALAIARTAGQDTQRAFGAIRWDLRRITVFGQEFVVTGYARADAYNSRQNALTTTVSYQGAPGFQGRGIAALAAELRWPFVGQLFGGFQRITPRIQFVASPTTKNLMIPNEDARAVDLEDSNLFALNRFPGYDRWEDGARVTYGLDYAFDAPGVAVQATVGQSYRLNRVDNLFPEGTGLTGRVTDIVGRYSFRFRDFFQLTQRFRLDKNNLAVRRNEVDATVGTRSTYALIGYLKLNRRIDPSFEDLRDREEIRLGGRVQITRYVSAFGSTIIDLTNKREDPTSIADGFQPVRHRLGIAYTDDCLDFGLTWRREYATTGDARSGNSFSLRLAFRGLGR